MIRFIQYFVKIIISFDRLCEAIHLPQGHHKKTWAAAISSFFSLLFLFGREILPIFGKRNLFVKMKKKGPQSALF